MQSNFERITGVGLVVWLALAATAHGQFGNYGPRYEWAPHRAAVDTRKESSDRYLPVVSLAAHERPGFERGIAALNRPVRGRFHEANLHDVIRRLEAESGCPIKIDVKALMDAVIDLDTLVTLDLDIQPMRIVLDGVLRPHALAFIPKSPGLLVTTQEQVDTNPDYHPVVLYPVYDLVALRHEGRIEYDFDTLISIITSTIHPDSWKEGGTGEGVIEPSPHFVGITVVQRWEVHEQLSGLLRSMRTLKEKLPFDSSASATSRLNAASPDGGRYEYRPRSRSRQRAYWEKSPPRVYPQVGGVF